MSLSVGVIGLGVMGAHHVQALGEILNVDVVAVADTNRQRAAELAEKIGGCRAHSSGSDLIADDAVQAVVIASPGEHHEEHVLACIAAQKPTLCEKPLAQTSAACHRLVEAEERLGRRLIQVGFMRRFDPDFVAMKHEFAQGNVGRPLVIHCVHRNASLNPAVEFTSSMMFTKSASHEIDVVRWVLGAEIDSATVHSPKPSGLARAGLQDPMIIVLQSKTGVVADIEVFQSAQYGYDIQCTIVGETGTVSLPSQPQVSTSFLTRFEAAYKHELEAWIDGIAVGTVLGPNLWDGYAATTVAEACSQSLTDRATTEVASASLPRLYGLGGSEVSL